MRTIHGLLKLVFTAALIAGGVVLYLHPISDLYALAVRHFPDSDLLRQILGAAAAVWALLVFLPLPKKRLRGKEISFQGTHGEVSIELEPVQSTLQRVLAKMPEVKSVSIQLKPQERPGRVSVLATAVLLKDADGDARQITARVNSYIQLHTSKILGLEDVDVKLKVKRFVMNMKTVKPEPLLLQAPQGGAVAASVQPVPEQAYSPEDTEVELAPETVDEVFSPVFEAEEEERVQWEASPSMEPGGAENEEPDDPDEEVHDRRSTTGW